MAVNFDTIGSGNTGQVYHDSRGAELMIKTLDGVSDDVDKFFQTKRGLEKENAVLNMKQKTGGIQQAIMNGSITAANIDQVDMTGVDTMAVAQTFEAKRKMEETARQNNRIFLEAQQARTDANAKADELYALKKLQGEKSLLTQQELVAKAESARKIAAAKEARELETYRKNLTKEARKEGVLDMADVISTKTYKEQDAFFNDKTIEPKFRNDVREVMKKFPERYGDSNGIAGYDPEVQGVVRNLQEQGIDPNTVVANKADTSMLHTYQKLRATKGKGKEAISAAKKIDPNAYKPSSFKELKTRADDLIKSIEYKPNIWSELGAGFDEAVTGISGIASGKGREGTNAEIQAEYLERLVAELPDGEDKDEASILIEEFRDLSERKRKGIDKVSDNLVLKRLERALPGSARRRKEAKTQTVKNVTKDLKNAK